MTKQLITIGDLHGDLDATLRILQGLELIDERGDWVGKNVHMVQIGDLIDRGRDSVDLMDYLLELQKQATTLDCRIDCLLGNHELMVAEQDFRYIHPTEILKYERFWYQGVNGLDALFRGDGPYATWIRNRPVMLLVDRVLFVHAGLDDWALDYTIDQINQVAREWVSHLQSAQLDSPAEDIERLFNGDRGLLWHEGFRVDVSGVSGFESVSIHLLERLLAHFSAEILIVGHRPTIVHDHRVAWPHPFYGNKVAVIDTGICDFYDGKLSASSIEGATLSVQYFDRGDGELELTNKIRQDCAKRRLVWAAE